MKLSEQQRTACRVVTETSSNGEGQDWIDLVEPQTTLPILPDGAAVVIGFDVGLKEVVGVVDFVGFMVGL